MRDAIARASQRLAHGIAGDVLRCNKRCFGGPNCGVPLAHRCARAVSTGRRLARRIGEFSEVELTFLDGHLDLMDLIARFRTLGDRAHQCLAGVGQGLFVPANFIRFLEALTLELIGDIAKTAPLRTRAFQRRRFCIELGLLFGGFGLDSCGLRACGFHAVAEIGEIRLRLLQK